MLDQRTVDLLNRVVSVFGDKAPVIRLDLSDNENPAIIIGDVLTVMAEDVTVERPSIRGVRTAIVPGYSLTLNDEDATEVGTATHVQDLALLVAVEYARQQAKWKLDEASWDAYAEELQQDRDMIEKARQEGRAAYPADVNTNPYPWGIAHYSAWLKGWGEAEGEAARKEYDAVKN